MPDARISDGFLVTDDMPTVPCTDCCDEWEVAVQHATQRGRHEPGWKLNTYLGCGSNPGPELVACRTCGGDPFANHPAGLAGSGRVPLSVGMVWEGEIDCPACTTGDISCPYCRGSGCGYCLPAPRGDEPRCCNGTGSVAVRVTAAGAPRLLHRRPDWPDDEWQYAIPEVGVNDDDAVRWETPIDSVEET